MLDPKELVVPRDHREWVWVPVEELKGEQYADWTEEIKDFFPADFLRKGGKDPPPLPSNYEATRSGSVISPADHQLECARTRGNY